EVALDIWYDGMLQIRDTEHFFPEGIRLSVFDYSGREVYVADIPDLHSQVSIPLDIKTSGVYMIRCVGRNGKRLAIDALYLE
ncbi:MAG: hypothetical protein HKN79_04705, partial [Flavobacteriales bacterium]|nr:hypothetical protein [Flavobacteriales bacterium]